MNSSIFDREEGTRWPRSQKFQLSAAGIEAEGRYQAVLKESQERGGRAAFDQATLAWSQTVGVRPGDGVYLSELRGAMKSLVALVEGLEACGATKSEAKAAIDRLIQAKLAEPVAR